MPNLKQHLAIGFVVGAAITYAFARLDNSPNPFAEALGGGIAGAGIALLPDLLEPATTPFHRGPAHSVAAGVLVTAGLRGMRGTAIGRRARAVAAAKQAVLEGRDPASAAFNDCFVSGLMLGTIPGYASHLVADAATPMCIPLA